MRNFLKSILNPHYKIILANSADRALAILQERTVDLIVSDVIMPGMNGIDFCRQLKSDIGYSHIPIVILSAKTDLRAKIAGLDAGAEVYLEKPFSGKYLCAQITSILHNRQIIKSMFCKNPKLLCEK